MSWMDDAACLGHGHLFFPAVQERPEHRQGRVSRALRLCKSCPVIEHCRVYARDEVIGVWAGEVKEDADRPWWMRRSA